MDGWLREDFEADQAVTGRIVAGVRQRVAHRRRTQTALGSALGVCAVALLAGNLLLDGRRPTTGGDLAADLRLPTADGTRSADPRPPAGQQPLSSFKPNTLDSRSQTPSSDRRLPTSDVASALNTQHSALDLSLSRVDHSVAVTWEGDPRAEYVVYRCSSPKFDTCSLADRVKGTQWVDPGQDSGTITYYRVEPKGQG